MFSLSAAQKAALAWWLPQNPAGARGLLFESSFPLLDALTLETLRAELRAMRARYRGTPSVLTAPFALWSTCSHGAPTHPITGESTCFWDSVHATDVEH